MSENEFTPSPLIVHCDEHLAKVREFAARTNQAEAFEAKLKDLCFFPNPEIRIHLYEDFAPYSFYWEAILGEKNDRANRYMNGGLIYHGSHDGGGNGSAPTFSVCLTPTYGWSIHT